jgi:hypothetical protein
MHLFVCYFPFAMPDGNRSTWNTHAEELLSAVSDCIGNPVNSGHAYCRNKHLRRHAARTIQFGSGVQPQLRHRSLEFSFSRRRLFLKSRFVAESPEPIMSHLYIYTFTWSGPSGVLACTGQRPVGPAAGWC